jgi:hypothetical protein
MAARVDPRHELTHHGAARPARRTQHARGSPLGSKIHAVAVGARSLGRSYGGEGATRCTATIFLEASGRIGLG